MEIYLGYGFSMYDLYCSIILNYILCTLFYFFYIRFKKNFNLKNLLEITSIILFLLLYILYYFIIFYLHVDKVFPSNKPCFIDFFVSFFTEKGRKKQSGKYNEYLNWGPSNSVKIVAKNPWKPLKYPGQYGEPGFNT